jgi:hypothetical protein
MKHRLKELFKKYGWKLGVAVFLGYLVRDVTLYIVLPYLIARSLI